MANEQDKKLFTEITKVFDASALQLSAMSKEITELSIKFGTHSAIVKTKKEQLAILSQLYDKTLHYINFLRELNVSMYNDFMLQDLMRHQRETGLPISKIMQLAGQDPEGWADVDKLDEHIRKLRAIRHELQIPEEVNVEFEEFIKALRNG